MLRLLLCYSKVAVRELIAISFLQARFWMQVIGELRMGVKLKKVNYSRTPIEYELTPYEILMDDIRSRRYTLRKVDGAIPQRWVVEIFFYLGSCLFLTLFEIFLRNEFDFCFCLYICFLFVRSVKKDAHAMILDFIRSRPPLKKVIINIFLNNDHIFFSYINGHLHSLPTP